MSKGENPTHPASPSPQELRPGVSKGERTAFREWGARALLLGLATALLLLPGCRFLFEEPTFRVLDLELTDVGFTSATAEVRVEVENPNWFELDLLGFAYEMELEDPGEGSEAGGDAGTTWVRLAEGHHEEPLAVPAGETAEFELEVPFDYEGMGAAVRSFLAQGTIPYRLQGDVQGRLLFWTLTFPFQAGGSIDMS